ncbi:thiamine biosynthesis protein ApbE [Paenibacillus selenitireducens]|uniref:FAD:protein FMN transferase n=1 Tax=Paenibacillus selenitireducens TaxID=1324314 RepID=A0A1T2X2E4_9BACL|nr:FAD:protein FMN transferase [Paenibacillus selenitireducens]OPA74007.1 thiamine biosynthesis protein ApbE [Paenibacillus selenitireducens]
MKNSTKLKIAAAAILLFVVAGSGYFLWSSNSSKKAPPNELVAKTLFKFDTVINLKLYGDQAAQKHLKEIEKMLDQIDEQINMSNNKSEIYQVNAAAGKDAVQVSQGTYDLVKASLDYAIDTKGAFDPSVGSLVNLWKIGNGGQHPPAESLIQQAKSLVNYRDIEMDDKNLTIKLAKAGMSLDLGGIGKGYAADLVSDYLHEEKVESAIIDLGGSSIIAIGSKPTGESWRIGLQDPDRERGDQLAVVQLQDETIDSSGVYERFFMDNGVRYHHILDPKTGYPTQNGIKSVTIIGGTATDADVLSTAVVIMGLEDGLAYIKQKPDVEAMFIMEDNKIYMTPGLEGKINLTNTRYTLVDSK